MTQNKRWGSFKDKRNWKEYHNELLKRYILI